MARTAFNKKALFTNKLDLNLTKKPVKDCIWSTASYDAEYWTLRKVYQKYLESFKMWYWRRMKNISCTDRAEKRGDIYRGSRRTGIL